MYIECAKGFFVLSSTIEARYQQALKALYSAVIVPLIQSFLTNLDTGPGFQIGGVTFDKDGLHRSSSLGAIQKGIFGAWASLTGGASVQEREQLHQHLVWEEFGGHSLVKGQVYLFRNKQTWAELPLRDTWNAVCLAPLFDFLYENGRLWQFVGKKAQTATRARILVVDDEEAVREIICSMLTAAGYDPYGVAGGAEALALLEAGEQFEILLSDLLNHPMDGLTLLGTTKARFPRIPVVIVSAVNDPSVTEACMKSGAYEYLFHPVSREKLLDTVRAALADQHDTHIRSTQPQN
jgi:CheY-like chemotaxis protein